MSCRIILLWLAPSAARMENSRLRAEARANNRLATFAHAINNTKLTAPSNIQRAGRTRPTISFCMGVRTTVQLVLVLGYCSSNRLAKDFICDCAACNMTVSLRRAMTAR